MQLWLDYHDRAYFKPNLNRVNSFLDIELEKKAVKSLDN